MPMVDLPPLADTIEVIKGDPVSSRLALFDAGRQLAGLQGQVGRVLMADRDERGLSMRLC